MAKYARTVPIDTAPAGMKDIPLGLFFFDDSGVEIEGNDDTGVDVQFPFEMHPQREHRQYMTVERLFVDEFPVTCSDYATFLSASGYRPLDRYRFLHNWDYDNASDTYAVPSGYGKKPVTYLGFAEAQQYCAYNGKRLPHSYEWQYAAQGNTSWLYPWGSQQGMGSNFPKQQNGRTLPGPADVDAFATKGRSMFGVADLVGNVWQYTSAFSDAHTRSVVTRGSANYRPAGSQW